MIMISYYLAPMEGVTDHRFRTIQADCFGSPDRSFTPFIAPTECHRFTAKDLRELDPDRQGGLLPVPQLIGKNADDILWAISELKEMGFTSVNLNFGCPSGTVVKKKKGAGILSDLEFLRVFLTEIYSHAVLPVSIKTRTGIEDNRRFPEILAIYDSFPVSELILHPRYQKQMYKGIPDEQCWELARSNSHIPLCYNGNLFNANDAENFSANNPDTPVMIGRGAAANPAIFRELRSGERASKEEFQEFHRKLYQKCREEIGYEKAVLLHMKEIWFYFSCSFEGSARPLKRILKSEHYEDYSDAAEALFSACSLNEPCGFHERSAFD